MTRRKACRPGAGGLLLAVVTQRLTAKGRGPVGRCPRLPRLRPEVEGAGTYQDARRLRSHPSLQGFHPPTTFG